MPWYYGKCRKLAHFLLRFFLYFGLIILEVVVLGLAVVVLPVIGSFLLVFKFFYFLVDIRKPKR